MNMESPLTNLTRNEVFQGSYPFLAILTCRLFAELELFRTILEGVFRNSPLQFRLLQKRP